MGTWLTLMKRLMGSMSRFAPRWGKFGQWNFLIKFIGLIIFNCLYDHTAFKKKIPYTVLKMKWPIGGANMVNDFYIPCSLRNNSAIQRLLTIIYCRISNNFSTYFSCTIFTPPCPNLPLSSFAPHPLIISMGYFLDSQHVMSFSSVATSMGT